MFLKSGFLPVFLFFAIVPSFAVQSPANPIPDEFVQISKSIQRESSRAKRLELLVSLQSLSKKRVREIPPSIAETELAKVEVLFELDLYLADLRTEMLNPANCGKTETSITLRANPKADGEKNMTPTGRFVLGIVKSLCRQ